ncbi:hypothetical protein MLOOGBEN_06495 [Bacillus sp. EB106-08-02-XG196]|uniref:hypothetical protein n=1 Tax=Bacillus sp. EB106-08-02-XG196 TaxID=2737049 RepID=UPI0015C46C40|nr:hypothetical protein [Bacillus sp. EB106-08-02-XG196]NWQ40348.1 hypothetical protein [Bacillus sp. EB106-08-02-XG196]
MGKNLKPIKELEENSYTQKREVYCVDFQVTFREFVNSWFYEEYKIIVGPYLFSSRCFDMDHILPVFGDKMISEISMKDIYIFCNDLEKGGYSQSTISNILALSSELLYEAKKRGLICSIKR